MTYFNPLYRYGVERFVNDAAAAGLDGLIVPDLPPEEATELEQACRRAGWRRSICLRQPAPKNASASSSAMPGFIYMVSVTSVTGAHQRTAA